MAASPSGRAAGRSAIAVDVIVDAPPQLVWDAIVDWAGQGSWMVASRIRVVGDRTEGLGTRLEAVTGLGDVGFVDPMVVVEWEPPTRCVVKHTGRVVRGTGAFEVFALPAGRSRLVWSEQLDLPLGVVGRAGWPVVRPALVAAVRRSLQKLARDLAGSRG